MLEFSGIFAEFWNFREGWVLFWWLAAAGGDEKIRKIYIN
jgi:hypothetical protein